MRKISIFLTLLTTIFAQINWEKDFNSAYKKALKENKLIFVFIERKEPPCRWCHKMLTSTLSDKKIEEFINKNFIPVKLDKDSSNYPDELYPKYVPTIYIIQKNRVLKRVVGFWELKDFWSDLNDIKQKIK